MFVYISGSALYLGASIIDHSCAPNATFISNGKEIIIRAIENVNSFEDLRITYIPKLYESTSRRREILTRDYYFFCQCLKCQNMDLDAKKNSLLCPKCKDCIPITIGKHKQV